MNSNPTDRIESIQKTKIAVDFIEAKVDKLTVCDEPKAKRTFRAVQYADDIRDGFKVLRESSALCDCTLIAQDAQFAVHKSLLASVSDYFRAMFCSGMRETTSSLGGRYKKILNELMQIRDSVNTLVNLSTPGEILLRQKSVCSVDIHPEPTYIR